MRLPTSTRQHEAPRILEMQDGLHSWHLLSVTPMLECYSALYCQSSSILPRHSTFSHAYTLRHKILGAAQNAPPHTLAQTELLGSSYRSAAAARLQVMTHRCGLQCLTWDLFRNVSDMLSSQFAETGSHTVPDAHQPEILFTHSAKESCSACLQHDSSAISQGSHTCWHQPH